MVEVIRILKFIKRSESQNLLNLKDQLKGLFLKQSLSQIQWPILNRQGLNGQKIWEVLLIRGARMLMFQHPIAFLNR